MKKITISLIPCGDQTESSLLAASVDAYCISQFQEMDTNKRSKSRPMHGWIYFLRADNGLVKIGKSRRLPSKRLNDFSPKLPFETHLAYTLETQDVDETEKFLHAVFSPNRVRGEWFNVSDSSILSVTPTAAMYGARSLECSK